jgi:hypothetical protein
MRFLAYTTLSMALVACGSGASDTGPGTATDAGPGDASRPCAPGMCTPVKLASEDAWDVVVDDTNVYYVNPSGAHGVPKTGGAAFGVAATTLPPDSMDPTFQRIALAGGTLYWMTEVASAGLATHVESAPAAARGTTATKLYDGVFPNALLGFGAASSTLFFVDTRGGVSALPATAGASPSPLTAGPCGQLGDCPQPSVALDLDDGFVFAVFTSTIPSANVLERVHVPDGAMNDVPLSGVSGIGGHPPAAGGAAVAAFGGTLYTIVPASDGTATIYASGLDGVGPQMLARLPLGGSVAGPMVADSAAAYVAVGTSILRVDRASGALLQVFTSAYVDTNRPQTQVTPFVYTPVQALALDGQFLYVADLHGIYRVVR